MNRFDLETIRQLIDMETLTERLAIRMSQDQRNVSYRRLLEEAHETILEFDSFLSEMAGDGDD